MKTIKSNHIALLSAALLAFATGGLAVNTYAADLNATETKFVKDVGEAGMGEVKVATLGTQKAERTDVKELATMLVADHTKTNEELAAFAKARSVDISAVISSDAADKFKDLEKESGKGFDDAFLAHMEKCHKKSIDAFEDIEKNGTDGELKSWVSKTLPTLRAHLDKVKALRAK